MNLNKENWRKVKLGEVVNELRTTTNYASDGLTKYIGFEHLQSNNLKISAFGDLNDGVSFTRTFKTNDILFGKIRAYLRKLAITSFDGVCSGDIAVLRAKDNEVLNQHFLSFALTTEKFFNLAVHSAVGTTMPRTKWQHIENYQLPLPPLEEQQKIADLFQSTDAAIEHADKQEKNLRTLAKRLIDGLINDKPTFGNLLESQKLSKVKFADVTECIEQHDKQPLEKGLTLFIGLENIEPENFRISTWGNIADGTTFTKTFASGDILFGKRRSYLKKVAIAEFDGICSSDILVFRAKQNKMLAELLPFYAASEAFIQYAVNTSAGSLSPRTKWRDLAKFELNIPNLEIQSKILDVLLHIQTTIEQVREQKQTLKNLKFKLLNDILG